jgi:hypothetical protein
MYVGQEPCGWKRLKGPAEVVDLMELHASFMKDPGKLVRTPFWSFGYALDTELNPDGPKRSFIWSNISRIGKAGKAGRVYNDELDFWSKHRLLAAEVKLLSPKVVVFVTGPNYDDLLEREFPGIELPRLSLSRPIAKLSHQELPDLTFRSYHPAYLRRKQRKQCVIDFVVRRTQKN